MGICCQVLHLFLYINFIFKRSRVFKHVTVKINILNNEIHLNDYYVSNALLRILLALHPHHNSHSLLPLQIFTGGH